MALRNDAAARVRCSTQLTHGATGIRRRHDAIVRIRFDNWLGPGRYRLLASVARAGAMSTPTMRGRTSAR